jgi:hypothetical protein
MKRKKIKQIPQEPLKIVSDFDFVFLKISFFSNKKMKGEARPLIPSYCGILFYFCTNYKYKICSMSYNIGDIVSMMKSVVKICSKDDIEKYNEIYKKYGFLPKPLLGYFPHHCEAGGITGIMYSEEEVIEAAIQMLPENVTILADDTNNHYDSLTIHFPSRIYWAKSNEAYQKINELYEKYKNCKSRKQRIECNHIWYENIIKYMPIKNKKPFLYYCDQDYSGFPEHGNTQTHLYHIEDLTEGRKIKISKIKLVDKHPYKWITLFEETKIIPYRKFNPMSLWNDYKNQLAKIK